MPLSLTRLAARAAATVMMTEVQRVPPRSAYATAGPSAGRAVETHSARPVGGAVALARSVRRGERCRRGSAPPPRAPGERSGPLRARPRFAGAGPRLRPRAGSLRFAARPGPGRVAAGRPGRGRPCRSRAIRPHDRGSGVQPACCSRVGRQGTLRGESDQRLVGPPRDRLAYVPTASDSASASTDSPRSSGSSSRGRSNGSASFFGVCPAATDWSSTPRPFAVAIT